MKQCIFVLAVALLLASLPWQDAATRQNPAGVGKPYQDSGEDHPWGGEGNGNDPIVVTTPGRTPGGFTTGIGSIDVFNQFIMPTLWDVLGTDYGSLYIGLKQSDQPTHKSTESTNHRN